MIDIIIFRNIFFIMIHLFVVNKISSNSSINCKKYWKQHNVQYARTAFILIFTDYFHFFNNFITFFHQFINQFFPTLTIFIIQIPANITWFITFTLAITRIPNIPYILYTFMNLFFIFTPIFTIIPRLLIITNGCI